MNTLSSIEAPRTPQEAPHDIDVVEEFLRLLSVLTGKIAMAKAVSVIDISDAMPPTTRVVLRGIPNDRIAELEA